MRYLSSSLTLLPFSRTRFKASQKNQALAQSSTAHIPAQFLQMFSFEKMPLDISSQYCILFGIDCLLFCHQT